MGQETTYGVQEWNNTITRYSNKKTVLGTFRGLPLLKTHFILNYAGN